MVESFTPRTAITYGGEENLARQIDYSDVEALIQADTRDKLSAYRLERGSIFARSDDPKPKGELQSLALAREVLMFAISAKNCANKTVEVGVPLRGEEMTSDLSIFDFPDLEEIGYEHLVPDCVEMLEAKPSERTLEAYHNKVEIMRMLDNPEDFIANPSDMRLLDYTEDVTGAALRLTIPAGPYAEYLFRSIEEYGSYKDRLGEACEWEAWYLRHENGDVYMDDRDNGDTFVCVCALGLYEKTFRGAVDLLNETVDKLFTIHLTGLRTLCVNGGKEARRADTGLSSLWWSALDMLREGRVDSCWACGKPFIAYNERGKQRRYCSDSCKQWRKKHKGDYLRSEYAKMTPEERKAADERARLKEDDTAAGA